MSENLHKIHLTSFQVIILGFAGVILSGALLLMLPWASVKGAVTPFHEALFTATSAVCVTGLVVQDTGSYWSSFGQAVILILIQTGGFGVVTVAAAVSMMSGRKISLMQRSTMQNAISAPKVGGIVRLTKFILKGTFLIEGMGALLLLPVFCHDFGWKGIWMAVFHSVSAFCNAGFDILGREGHLYPSIVGYADNILVNGVIIGLIIIGGIGFLTWEDICEYKWKFKIYRMQSKLILATTVCLIIFPACFAYGVDPGQGPGLIFVTLPNVFNAMPGGRLWGTLFFLFMCFAAFSTVIGVFQNLITFWTDMTDAPRKKIVAYHIVALIVLCLPCALGYNVLSGLQPLGEGTAILDLEDFLVSNNILPLGSIVYVLFCACKNGWGWENFMDEANAGEGLKFPNGIRLYVKYILPLIILFVFVMGYLSMFSK